MGLWLFEPQWHCMGHYKPGHPERINGTDRLMEATRLKIGKTRRLKILAGECLDWKSYNHFDEAAFECSKRSIRNIEIDFCKTTVIYNSGFMMLLMLIKKTRASGCEITLVNCRPGIRDQLAECTFANRFRFAQPAVGKAT